MSTDDLNLCADCHTLMFPERTLPVCHHCFCRYSTWEQQELLGMLGIHAGDEAA